MSLFIGRSGYRFETANIMICFIEKMHRKTGQLRKYLIKFIMIKIKMRIGTKLKQLPRQLLDKFS